MNQMKYPDKNEILAALKSRSDIWSNGTYLRGSIVRDEPPYDDIDVFEIGDVTTPPAHIPPDIKGVRVEYATYTPKALSEYLDLCPRSWYIHYDATPVRSTPQTEDLLGEARVAYETAGKDVDYLMFLAVEDMLGVLRPSHPDSAYEFAKNLPGGKRSIMRVAAMLRAMYTEFESMTTPQVLNAAVQANIVPAVASRAVQETAVALSSVHDHIGVAIATSQKNANWITQFREKMLEGLKPSIGSVVLETIMCGLHSQSGRELYQATRVLRGTEEPWRRWTMAFTLAQNPWLPNGARATLSDLFSGYTGTLIEKCLQKASDLAPVSVD